MSATQSKPADHVIQKGDVCFRFVRSAETEFDDQDRVGGSLDLPLSDKGRGRLHQLSRQYAHLNVVGVYSAICSAAQDTAKAIAEPHGCKVRAMDVWQNLDHGLWHGKCHEEIRIAAPRFYRQWQDSPETIAPPEGETFDAVKRRCQASIEKVAARRHRAGDILIVAPDPLLQILFELLAVDAD